MTAKLPEIFTSRYLNEGVLCSSRLVPVRVSMREPIVPLGYVLRETAWSLVPEEHMEGEWPWLSPAYWLLLHERGADAISEELAEISGRHGGRPLCLLDHEDVTRGDRSLRLVFSRFWEERAGQSVLEIADDGRWLHYKQLPKRTRPRKGKAPGEDRRWTKDAPLGWPVREEELRRWIAGRHWQTARAGDHQYTHRDWGDRGTFLRVVQHVRENAEQEEFHGDTYNYLVVDGFKYWSMGSDLMSTIILNRRRVGQDGEQQADRAGAAPDGGLAPPMPGLFDGEEKT